MDPSYLSAMTLYFLTYLGVGKLIEIFMNQVVTNQNQDPSQNPML